MTRIMRSNQRKINVSWTNCQTISRLIYTRTSCSTISYTYSIYTSSCWRRRVQRAVRKREASTPGKILSTRSSWFNSSRTWSRASIQYRSTYLKRTRKSMNRSMWSRKIFKNRKSRMGSTASDSATPIKSISTSNLVTRPSSVDTRTSSATSQNSSTEHFTTLMLMAYVKTDSSQSWTSTQTSKARYLPTWSTSTTKSFRSPCLISNEVS